MQVREFSSIVICVIGFLSLSIRQIVADSRSANDGHGKVTVNLDDLVIEVSPPVGRESLVNAEPFYQQWQNVDDVAYWESIYGSMDNIPAFEDLPEIIGETFELKLAGETDDESSNVKDTGTSGVGVAKRIVDESPHTNNDEGNLSRIGASNLKRMKESSIIEPSNLKQMKESSSDRCHWVNPLYPREKLPERRRRSSDSVKKSVDPDDLNRRARTLSLLRGDSGKSRRHFNRYPDPFFNSYGTQDYRSRVPIREFASFYDCPKSYDTIDERKFGRIADSSISAAELVNSRSADESVNQAVADAMASAARQLVQAKHDAIDLGLGDGRAIGSGKPNNNAVADRTEDGNNAGEAKIDRVLEVVGNSVLDTNSGMVNEDIGIADVIGATLGMTNVAGSDATVENLGDNDVDETQLIDKKLNRLPDDDGKIDAVINENLEAIADESRKEKIQPTDYNPPKISEPIEIDDEPRVTKNSSEISSNIETIGGPRVVSEENIFEEKNNDVDRVAANLKVNSREDADAEIVESGLIKSEAIEAGADTASEVAGENVGSSLRINTKIDVETSINAGISSGSKTGINIDANRHRGNERRPDNREDFFCECCGFPEDEETAPREFYPRRYYDKNYDYEEDYRRILPEDHRYYGNNMDYQGQIHDPRVDENSGIRTSPNAALSANTDLRDAIERSGLHANSGTRSSLDEGIDLNSDAFAGYLNAESRGSFGEAVSRANVRDGNCRSRDEDIRGISTEYEDYYDEPEYRQKMSVDPFHSSRYRGVKSGIRGNSEIRTSHGTAVDINSADGLRAGSRSSLDLESHLDIGSATLGVNGANPLRHPGAINSGVTVDGELHTFRGSELGANAGGHSQTGIKSSLDVDSHLDIGTNRPSVVDESSRIRENIGIPRERLGEKICDAACREISDLRENAAWSDSRFDEAYDGRSEYPDEERSRFAQSKDPYYLCDDCKRRFYGEIDTLCPICGRSADRPYEGHQHFPSRGTMYHFHGPKQISTRAADPRKMCSYNHRINLNANCTGEAASRSSDCEGMNYDLQTPRDGNPVPLVLVRDHLSHGHDIALDMHDRARSLVADGLHPKPHTASMLHFFHSKVPADLVRLNEESELTLFGTKLLQQKLSLDYSITPNNFLEFLDHHGFRVTGDRVCQGRRKRCGGRNKFRSLDGSCNNSINPTWGRSNGAFARILPARYSDGIHGMPMSVTGAELPNPRKLSVRLFSRNNSPDPELTLAVVQWGQTLAHDLARQVMDQTTEGGIECCGENGKSHLPKSLQHHSCAPISISPRDKFYSSHGQRCMNFVRAMTVTRENCTLGSADQLNGATSFLDCSPMYGVDKATSDELREFTGGRMKVEFRSGRWMLPTMRNSSNFCDIWSSDDVCYKTGDPRNNQNPQLAILQTLLVREHNRIANGLSALNLNWNDERIFQESRRIVIAEYQHITYNEWLPLLLGKRYCKKHGLVRTEPGMSDDYSERVNPSTIIGFTSGAFRSLHSMIEGDLGLCSAEGDFVDNLRLSDHYFRPRVIEKNNNFEHLLRGLTAQRMQKLSMHLHRELAEYLFRSRNDYGMDLGAMDIQRGRDHGVPGYNAYRKICRLRPARNFDDLAEEISRENIEKLRREYAHVDDIDLIVGAMMENRAPGSHFGPTNRCLIGEQFYRSRVGDKFFYDNEKYPHSFTAEQFNEITKVKLSRLMCDMGGAVVDVQRYAFRAMSPKNPLVSCEDLPKLDLTHWIE